MERLVRTVLVAWPTLRPLASYMVTLIRAVDFVDLTKTTRRLPRLVATTRAERMDALLAFLAAAPVAERAALAPPAATCWMIVVVDVVLVDVVWAGADTGALQSFPSSDAGELVPGASGSEGSGPLQS